MSIKWRKQIFAPEPPQENSTWPKFWFHSKQGPQPHPCTLDFWLAELWASKAATFVIICYLAQKTLQESQATNAQGINRRWNKLNHISSDGAEQYLPWIEFCFVRHWGETRDPPMCSCHHLCKSENSCYALSKLELVLTTSPSAANRFSGRGRRQPAQCLWPCRGWAHDRRGRGGFGFFTKLQTSCHWKCPLSGTFLVLVPAARDAIRLLKSSPLQFVLNLHTQAVFCWRGQVLGSGCQGSHHQPNAQHCEAPTDNLYTVNA